MTLHDTHLEEEDRVLHALFLRGVMLDVPRVPEPPSSALFHEREINSLRSTTVFREVFFT